MLQIDTRLKLPDGSPNPNFSKHIQILDFSKFKAYTPEGRDQDTAEVMLLSGGRSSAYALMSLIKGGFGTQPNHVVMFQNTGKEHKSCYDFIKRLQEVTSVDILWLEYAMTDKFREELVVPGFDYDKFNRCGYNSIYDILDVEKLCRMPYSKNQSSFWYVDGYCDNVESCVAVSYETASRNGKPFTDIFLYYAALSIMQGRHIMLPNAAQRWCTGKMKEQVGHRWMVDNGHSKYIKHMGMRHDEPLRVDRMFRKNDNSPSVYIDCPLHWLEVDKLQVLQAWKAQPIDLGLDEATEVNSFRDVIGNCDFCHLKGLLKKLYLIQQGFSVGFYKQLEIICSEFNDIPTIMKFEHGSYAEMETKALSMPPIDIREVLSSEEIEISCVGCGD